MMRNRYLPVPRHQQRLPGPVRGLCALLLAVLFACSREGPEPTSKPSPEDKAGPAPSVEFELPVLDDADYRFIASRIALNETGGLERHLTHWGAGEDFPSFGIGHFIWFPAGVDAPFDESFPALVTYLEQTAADEATMPGWLERRFREQGVDFDAPWPDKQSFDEALDSDSMLELRSWLAATAPQQARFIAWNFVTRWNALELSAREKETLTRLLQQLVETPQGLFAVIDYVNFKGLGTNPRERYDGRGWGLLQVLNDVAAAREPNDEPRDLVRRFSEAAASRLRDRVALSPPARNEARWLEGWIERVSQYPGSGAGEPG
ncbi:MAG TPA: hypothetical protein VKZ91_13200 [Woeseiaceae bacterium]|nr:hypothetical protein [Woeseiaceae bacterium]